MKPAEFIDMLDDCTADELATIGEKLLVPILDAPVPGEYLPWGRDGATVWQCLANRQGKPAPHHGVK